MCLSQREAAHPVDQQFAEPSCGFILRREVPFPAMDGAHPHLGVIFEEAVASPECSPTGTYMKV